MGDYIISHKRAFWIYGLAFALVDTWMGAEWYLSLLKAYLAAIFGVVILALIENARPSSR